MLRMKPIASGKRAELYYARTDGGQDAAGYYHEASGLRCEWGGKGAARLGLEGTPEFEQFKRLIHGLDPNTGQQLTARLVDHRIPAWDVTASVPKGVTTALERGDSRIQGAMWRAFGQAMAMLEDYAETRVRSDGRQEDRRTGNLVYYAVEHPETRPVEDASLPENHPWRVMPDWDRHIHGVVFNLTFDDAEGRWKALKFRPIMEQRRYFDRAFESLLSSELAGLGYEIETKWQRDASGGGRYRTWDIAGIPESVLAKNSRRTAEVDAKEEEIVAGLKERSASAPDKLSAVARDQLGATSRRQKREDVTLEECREFWNSRITEEEGAAISETIRRAVSGENPKPHMTAERAARFAARHCFEQQSCVRAEELMTVAMERSLGAATPAEIGRELKRLGVFIAEIDGEKLATTEALQAEERSMAAAALSGRGAVAAVGVSDRLTRTLEGGGQLNDGQWQAVLGLLASENRFNLVEGPAGAGKSSMLAKFDEGARLAGQSVTYLATTSAAAKVLEQDGFSARTVAHFLLDEKMQAAACGGRVVVDEASMLGHADAVKLFAVAREQNLKIVFVGDRMQHGSVARGAILRLLTDHGRVQPCRLSEILRQQEPEYRAAAEKLAEGKSVEGFDALDAKGWVREINDDEERYRLLAAEYVAAMEANPSLPSQGRALVVSPTHAEAARITAEIRSQLRAAGRLGQEEREFTRLVQINASEAERGQAETYQPGDVLVFHQNAKGFTKGQRLTVTDPKSVPLDQAARFSVYRQEAIGLSRGDVLRFTGTVKTLDGKHTLKNGTSRSVAGFDKGGNLVLDNGWTVGKDAGHFRQGFVETSFGAQGRTVQHVIIGMAASSLPAANMEQIYVSGTRAKQQLTLFTDDKEAVREGIRKSSQKRLALDLPPPERPDAAERQAKRRQEQISHRRRRGILEAMRAAWNRAWPRNPRRQAAELTASHAERLGREHYEKGQAHGR